MLLIDTPPPSRPALVGRGHAGGKMPMGMGRDAAGGAERGRWKQMAQDVTPKPPACGKVPARGQEAFVPSSARTCPSSWCPLDPKGNVPGTGSDPTWGTVGCNPTPVHDTELVPPPLQVCNWVQSMLQDWNQHSGPNVGTSTSRRGHMDGCRVHPPLQPLQPSIGVPGGDTGVPRSAPGREGGKDFYLISISCLPIFSLQGFVPGWLFTERSISNLPCLQATRCASSHGTSLTL